MNNKGITRTISLNEGEYTIEYTESTGEMLVRRYGAIWRNHTGDKFMLAVFEKLDQGAMQYDIGYTEGRIRGTRSGYDLGFKDGYIEGVEDAVIDDHMEQKT